MDNPIPINLPDMQSRVEHGYHLTNEEARWLLSQIGKQVPRRMRCTWCGGEGIVPKYVHVDGSNTPDGKLVMYQATSGREECTHCRGSGFKPVQEPSYEVIGNHEDNL